ncbi:MAG TPA: transporter, partial [Chromatiales bacterium]|nr:transporter [Chromatiales bacterium]
DRLYVQASSGPLTAQQRRELHRLKGAIRNRREIQVAAQRQTIRQVRDAPDEHRDRAQLRLGGLPMIVADMLDFILRDVMVFGAAIVVFLVGLLALIFRRPRWIILPLLTCLASAVLMTGLLGLARMPVTVVSANFVALLLIFCLSLTVHLIVRYQELHKLYPDASQRELVARTLRDKWLPCAYTSATTMVAFTSLLVSGIQPVIDFGWLMVAGMVVLLLLSFTLFPAGLMLVPAGKPQQLRRTTEQITLFFAKLTSRFPVTTLAVYLMVGVVAVAGLLRLEVESRFIDNFRDTTEIYQGLVTIDRELGGTTPLDVVLDADPAFFDRQQATAVEGDGEFSDEFDAEFDDEPDNGLGASSYWYNSYQLGRVADVQRYLESLPETGKVLSIATTIQTLTIVNEGRPPDTFFLSLLYRNLPEPVRQSLFDPYLSEDGNQVRLSVRVRESDPDLRRQQLLDRIRGHLIGEMGFSPEQVHLSGMLVLYNNVLQSLYRSQILTIGFVFLSILAMFFALFRSLKLALIALIPNVLAAGAVLGMMGLAGIPLDIMTITIAAIAVGIGVDDSIHYVYRFRVEFGRHHSYAQALHDSHASIGRAMYYTSVIVAVGFSILALSN